LRLRLRQGAAQRSGSDSEILQFLNLDLNLNLLSEAEPW
jgi:hypothetical protein